MCVVLSRPWHCPTHNSPRCIKLAVLYNCNCRFEQDKILQKPSVCQPPHRGALKPSALHAQPARRGGQRKLAAPASPPRLLQSSAALSYNDSNKQRRAIKHSFLRHAKNFYKKRLTSHREHVILIMPTDGMYLSSIYSITIRGECQTIRPLLFFSLSARRAITILRTPRIFSFCF